MSYGETFMTGKCSNGAGTLKQDVQTFMMQAVREGSECQLMMLFSNWIRETRRLTISVLSDSFPRFQDQLSVPQASMTSVLERWYRATKNVYIVAVTM